MTSRPIIFSAPMVRAILAGTKTQTRRVITPQPEWTNGAAWYWRHPRYDNGDGVNYFHSVWVTDSVQRAMLRCAPWQAGDTLWVRETWYSPPRPLNDCLGYAADGDHPHGQTYRQRPSIHMPRAAARIQLRVTSVRVERLQEISDADARAEGVELELIHRLGGGPAFRELWDSINAERAPWSSNPWVWVVEFEREKP